MGSKQRGVAQQIALLGFRWDMDDLKGRLTCAQSDAESSRSRSEHLQQQLDKARSELSGSCVLIQPCFVTSVLRDAE